VLIDAKKKSEWKKTIQYLTTPLSFIWSATSATVARRQKEVVFFGHGWLVLEEETTTVLGRPCTASLHGLTPYSVTRA
jgi:hypothetical protein